MHRIDFHVRNIFNELRTNKRLQLACLALLLIAILEGSLRWSDRISAQSAELNKIRGEISTLKQESSNESAIRASLGELEKLKAQIDERLWQAPSEAVGQARLKDWLNEAIQRTGLSNPTINMASPRPLDAQKDKAGSASPAKDSKTSSGLASEMRELRATISFRFTPEAVERFLAEIEASNLYAAVDTLTINRREMRAEMGIVVLLQLSPSEASQ